MTRREYIKTQSLAITGLTLAPFSIPILKNNYMPHHKEFEVIIIGGSYAGLSAAMALGRALRDVLIIDSGLPCNRYTPYAHNLLTHDGTPPAIIAEESKNQVLNYETIKFVNDLAISGKKSDKGYIISTKSGNEFSARKLIFATGIKDIMPKIDGFEECWGKTILHCPYCHGYEVRNEKTGIFANGDMAFQFARLINNWTKELTIFTNGPSTLSEEQTRQIGKNNITIVQHEISHLEHQDGKMQQVVFKDQSTLPIKASYARPEFEQHSKIPQELGCELTEQGLIQVSTFQQTNLKGIFACGDNSSPLRAISCAIAAGNIAGAMANHEMVEEEF